MKEERGGGALGSKGEEVEVSVAQAPCRQVPERTLGRRHLRGTAPAREFMLCCSHGVWLINQYWPPPLCKSCAGHPGHNNELDRCGVGWTGQQWVQMNTRKASVSTT